MSTPALRVCGLAKAFRGVAAVRQLDLELQPGRILALLGPSGCGKTTTLRLIAGFEAPDAGTIEIDGRMVAGSGAYVPPERRRVGMVFQDHALFPHLDVAGNVGFGLARGPGRAERVRAMLDLVGLAGMERRYPHQLSGGQQQRVALARALAPGPALILLDEPFANLDAALRGRVRAEVVDILRRAGATAVFVTHDQVEAFSVADTVAVMFRGSIAQEGTPEEVYAHPVNREVGLFVGEATLVAGEAHGDAATCEFGEVPIATPGYGPVEVLVRPEAVTAVPDPDGYEVVAREYLGAYERFTVQLNSGQRLQVQTPGDTVLRVGHRVRLYVRVPCHAYAFERAAAPHAPMSADGAVPYPSTAAQPAGGDA